MKNLNQLLEVINRKIVILSPTALAKLRENVNTVFKIINGLQIGKRELLEAILNLEKDMVNILKAMCINLVVYLRITISGFAILSPYLLDC